MMTIPKGSNSGKILRLKGRGAYASGKRGDLLAKLAVTLPETPDDELIRFATEWRDKRSYTPGR
ncbi:Curved DNA-binding protein [compost metagenome]